MTNEEIDLEIDKKIFGITFPTAAPSPNQFSVQPAPGKPKQYSTDIACAWDIVKHLNASGKYNVIVKIVRPVNDRAKTEYECEITTLDHTMVSKSHVDSSAAFAICMAALTL